MKTADALMVIYYVVLSGLLVFTLGYLAGWRHTKPWLSSARRGLVPFL
jgi:hypothetical protein